VCIVSSFDSLAFVVLRHLFEEEEEEYAVREVQNVDPEDFPSHNCPILIKIAAYNL
jgi:hypothetical protein